MSINNSFWKFSVLPFALEALSRVLLSVASEFRKQQCVCRMYRTSGLFSIDCIKLPICSSQWDVSSNGIPLFWNWLDVWYRIFNFYLAVLTKANRVKACAKALWCRTGEDGPIEPTPTSIYCSMFGCEQIDGHLGGIHHYLQQAQIWRV